VADRDNPIREAAVSGSFAPVVDALIRLRGIDGLSAVTVLAERGDITRFDNPRQLMSFLGLVPSEHSSGARRRTGAITRTGNGPIRRILVEAAWNYRFPARKTRHLEAKANAAPERVQTLAPETSRRKNGSAAGTAGSVSPTSIPARSPPRWRENAGNSASALSGPSSAKSPIAHTPAGPGPETKDPSSHDRLRVQTDGKNPPSRYAAYLFKIYDPRS